jgi:LysR family transcriptional activator of mexEF-oprN operon
MNGVYGRDLDLNLLRVFVVVAETGSVTVAADRLYLTQPAISAALRRLSSALDAPLFTRSGRGLVLTARGRRLLAAARPHLAALVDAALAPPAFDPKTSDRMVRLGLSDASEGWLLPPLLQHLSRVAPRLRLVVVPVQFRTVAHALGSAQVDLAVTVADDAPKDVQREPLFMEGFVCLYDPRYAQPGKRLTLERYLAHEHVIVSYNADLRGVVEDAHGIERRVRVSVPTFHSVGAIVSGSALLATLPLMVARHALIGHPELRTIALPFALEGAPLELLWQRATDDDDALRVVREGVLALARVQGAR